MAVICGSKTETSAIGATTWLHAELSFKHTDHSISSKSHEICVQIMAQTCKDTAVKMVWTIAIWKPISRPPTHLIYSLYWLFLQSKDQHSEGSRVCLLLGQKEGFTIELAVKGHLHFALILAHFELFAYFAHLLKSKRMWPMWICIHFGKPSDDTHV